MASDSRLTLSRTLTNENAFKAQQNQVLMDIVQSDANFKLFLAPQWRRHLDLWRRQC